MVSVFRNVGERSVTENYHSVDHLSVVRRVFEKLVYNKLVDHLEKCCYQSDFQLSLSTADHLTVVSDRIARAFTRSGATGAAKFD